MSVLFSPWGNQQFFDENGDPATGWKIETYAALSSTELATYTDSTGATPQSNPIELNALGMPTNGQIWLTSGLAYKFVLTDADGVVKKTADGITGVNDPAAVSATDEWVAYSGTPTYISATSFSVAGDQTGTFQVSRRVKSTNTGGTVYSTITASSFGGGLTTVTVVNASGTLDSGLSQVSYGLISPVSTSLPLGPAFLASPSAATSLTSGTAVKVTFGTKEYDTNSCFDATSSRFSPNVAGLYWIGGAVRLTNTATASLYIYKNGVQHREIGVTAQSANQQTSGGALVYLGTTDYVELYCSQSAATQNSSSSGVSTWFQGHFVRPL